MKPCGWISRLNDSIHRLKRQVRSPGLEHGHLLSKLPPHAEVYEKLLNENVFVGYRERKLRFSAFLLHRG